MIDKAQVRTDLQTLLAQALLGDAEPLETYLMVRSNLPGPRMNLELVGLFADIVGEAVARGGAAPTDALERLIDGWATLSLVDAPTNHPREILPATAALVYGQVAASRPDWRSDEISKLERTAADPRWRVREMTATGLQRVLEADWQRTCAVMVRWAASDNPLVARAAAAAVAEPRLLEDKAHAEDALAVQAEAVNSFLHIPESERRVEASRALRQALGYTLSVVTAASPETGFHLMEELAALPDPDIIWIIRENMKKKRLQGWQDRLDTLETALFRPETVDDADD